MPRFLIGLLSLLLSLSVLAHSHEDHARTKTTKQHMKDKSMGAIDTNKFGGVITQRTVTPLGEIVKNFDNFKGQTVVFEGTAKKVCKKSGCWMVIKDGDQEVRTLFKDYGFFVPKDILGKKVRVQGVMDQKKMSAAAQRHFMKDEGKKLNDIKKVKFSKTVFQFTADAVQII